MPNRRQFLAQAAAPLFAQSKPVRNVLFLIADDLGLHTGAYGDKTAVTPNLDKLAGEGVRFTNAFCTTASCSASRSVMLSGLHNHANGQYGHAHALHNFSYLPKVQPLPSLLKDAGYRTGVIGKLHVNPIERFRWDLDSQGQARNVQSMAQRARQFITESAGKPWYLHIGYADPHRAAKGFANQAYPGVKRQLFNSRSVAVPPFLPDNSETRGEVAEYYEATNRLDQGIGMMMDVLRQTNQLENTLVCFLSDNGMPFPNAKTNLYDAGMRLPLIVRTPGIRGGLVNNAMVNWTDLMPTALHWAGTKGPDYALHGRSILPILNTENPQGWDQVFMSHTFHEITMHYPMRGTRTRKHKYIHNLFHETSFPFASDLFESYTWQSMRRAGKDAMLGGRKVSNYVQRAPEELYDLETDPHELKNLAGASEQKTILEQLRADTRRFRKLSEDPWLVNDNYK